MQDQVSRLRFARPNSAPGVQTDLILDPILSPALVAVGAVATTPKAAAAQQISHEEIGGRDGLEPTRYGDWEKNGRCIDF